MSEPKQSPTGSSTRHAEARLQIFVGMGAICLATLIGQTAIRMMLSINTDSSPRYIPTGSLDDHSAGGASTPGLSESQVQTLLLSIAELSDLVKQTNASLHHNLLGKVAGRVCKGTEQQPEVLGAMLVGCLLVTISVCMWVISSIIFTESLSRFSKELRNRVWLCGLLGANAGLGYCILVVQHRPQPEDWQRYCSWTLWPMYAAMLGGLFSARKEFLAEEGVMEVDKEKALRKD